MGQKSKVSTVTSCFRGERFLPLFLKKIPEQTAFDRLELVIDLNEPTAEELRLVKNFHRDYPDHIRYTVQPKVVPYSVSWNNCIKNATGDYLAIWNLDDLRTPESIELQSSLLDSRPEIDVVHGKFRVVHTFGDEVGIQWKLKPATQADASWRFTYGPFYMFRKSLIEKAGYVDEQFLSSADFEHAVRLSYHGQSVEIEENLGYYLQAGQGLSTNPNSRVHLENFVISMRYGIYNKMWYHYLAEATQYNYYKILNGERWIPVENYVPDYRNMLAQRYRQRFDMGLIRHMVFKLKKEKWSGVKGIVEGLIK